MICGCDFDPNRVETNRQPVARKEHCCSYCGGTIRKGERYRYTFIVDYDGDPFTDRMCPDCWQFLNEANRQLHDGACGSSCWHFGPMDLTWDEAMEGELPPSKAPVIRSLVAMWDAVTAERGGTVLLEVPSWCDDIDDQGRWICDVEEATNG